MGSETPLTNHCSRTYWTPTMERFFIDLMLEHMHRGNRIGHTFNKQAWSDMLSVFNAKFGSQYDKDVLKSRYANLWKLFNDVKNLLAKDEFSWDETQQMVIAEDYAWDAYIKDHPEVRPYKTKMVLNFHDLCLIYGYTVADGRYSRSSHDIDVEDEAFLGNITLSGGEPSRTEWTLDMDDYLIDLLIIQQERGNKLDNNTFNKQAWTDMLTLFNVKFGPQHNKRVLRHRYKKLWKYYSDLSDLIKQKGFSWDHKQNLMSADDDVWDSCIKAHPHARSYRGKSLPNFLKLGLLFSDAVSKGIQSDLHKKKNIKSEVIQKKLGRERSRTYWTPPMEKYLIDLMLDQVRRGNRIGQSFITQAWTDMVASFNTQFSSIYDKDVLKNRYKHFRKQYNEVKVILERKGFSWDEGREMVIAEDNDWDSIIKAHPYARPYRSKTVPSYRKLCVIYGRVNLDENCSQLVRLVDRDIETSGGRLDRIGIEIDEEIRIDDISQDLEILDSLLETPDEGKKRLGVMSPAIMGRATKVQKMEKEEIHRDLTSASSGKSYGAIGSAIDALQAIPGIDDDLLLDGCDLFEDERKANTFLALDVTLRKKWLLRKLRRQSPQVLER